MNKRRDIMKLIELVLDEVDASNPDASYLDYVEAHEQTDQQYF